jgi:hypothetical protein
MMSTSGTLAPASSSEGGYSTHCSLAPPSVVDPIAALQSASPAAGHMYLILILEDMDMRHARVQREPRHMLRRVREGRWPRVLRECGIERGGYVEETERKVKV